MPRNSRCPRLHTPQYRRRWVVQGRCTSWESWVFCCWRPWPAPAAAGSDFRPPIDRCNSPSVGQREASGIMNLKSLLPTVATCTVSRRRWVLLGADDVGLCVCEMCNSILWQRLVRGNMREDFSRQGIEEQMDPSSFSSCQIISGLTAQPFTFFLVVTPYVLLIFCSNLNHLSEYGFALFSWPTSWWIQPVTGWRKAMGTVPRVTQHFVGCPPRSSHFESAPKVCKKQATNQVDGLPRTSSLTLNRLPAHTLQKGSFLTTKT